MIGVEVIHHKVAFGHLGVGGNQAPEIVDRVVFVAPAPVGRLDDLATRDIEVEDEALGTMPCVPKLLPPHAGTYHEMRGRS